MLVFSIPELLLIVLLAGCAVQPSPVQSYQDFRIREQEIVPQLDALNEAVAKTLPPLPSGATEDGRSSAGITSPIYEHGRWLRINNSTPLTSGEIAPYYRNALVAAGWTEYTGLYSNNFDLYIQGTGCLEIHYLTQRLHSYEITIWHDFQSQSFSPPLPDLDYMLAAEYGETNIATCPPN